MNSGGKAVNPKLSHLVRATLLAQGLTLSDWARANNIPRTSVSMALSGRRTDRRSRQILRMLEGVR